MDRLGRHVDRLSVAMAVFLAACSPGSKAATTDPSRQNPQVPSSGAASQSTAGIASLIPAPGTSGSGATPGQPTAGKGTGSAGVSAPHAGSPAVGTTAGGPAPLTPFTGPLDGDPAKPMVEIPGIKCGPPNAGFGTSPPSVKITNRDVVVAYPCAHEGAAVTFYLFLHGTLDDAQKVPFTMNAFAIHKLVDSHNVIVVVPKAVGTQWGNGDNGADLPHLYEVIDWVYATFGEKFNIRSMWAQGGSWGAAYLSNFACDPKLQDRLRGIQLVVGGGCPRCSDRLSCVVAQEELEKGNGNPLTAEQKEMYSNQAMIEPYAMKHGCGAKVGPMDFGNIKGWLWPNCSKGWVHSYYMGPGMHADSWDPAGVLQMTNEMKATEQ